VDPRRPTQRPPSDEARWPQPDTSGWAGLPRPSPSPEQGVYPPALRPAGHRHAVPDSRHGVASLLAVSGLCVLVLLAFVLVRIKREQQVAVSAPHAAIGAGPGGPVRVGDCVTNPGTGKANLRNCADGEYYGRVLARVNAARQCGPPAAEAISLRDAAQPVLCLQPKAQVGGCLATALTGPPDPVPCGDPRAVGKVIARAAAARYCPAGTVRSQPAPFGLAGQRVICLARPHP